MKSTQIRQTFIDFFKKRGHTHVPSSSLIPAHDPTLLFANAGMNQFKDIFLGTEKRSYTRAVTIQKCVRAGGKHNDLDNVGFTKRHLTFFEMMGNFSFGDYFKQDAIEWAWECLTKDLGLSPENIHATVFTTDDESYDIWTKKIGIPESKMHRLGEKDNFWQMGETGPCGPCTEIHLDRGPEFGCKDITQCGPGCDCDRFLEIWNLVFMESDRQPDGTFIPLQKKGVDTGMGLERIALVLQNKDSVYETDLFTPIIHATEKLTGQKYATQTPQGKAAFHVLADHIRSSSLIIADGGAPSNEGRGYVLRKIIRRAALFAQKLTDKNIFPELSKTVVAELGSVYPELKVNAKLIYKVLSSEIEKFAQNLKRGQHILDRYMSEQEKTKIITGEQAFKLYDTYGFPIELVHLMAKEKGFRVDEKGFEKHMAKQQEQSGKKLTDELGHLQLDPSLTTEFTGYTELKTPSKISALIEDGKEVKAVKKGKQVYVITQKSPFFIVGGGQVPDQGTLTFDGHTVPLDEVRYIGTAIGVYITAPCDIKVGDPVTSEVDKTWRTNAMKNHTATHMLQSALMQVLGKTIKQSGSLVHPDYLRFDFTYHENLSPSQIQEVEDIVNEKIREDIPVSTSYMTMHEALKKGALAFFGDKYNPEQVRLVEIPDYSYELCGGTHVPRTGVIGTFKITEVTALSAGHRRIVAVTGPRAIELFQDTYQALKTLSQEFKVTKEEVVESVLKQKDEVKILQSHIKKLKKELHQAYIPLYLQDIQTIGKVPFLFLSLSQIPGDEVRDLANELAHKKPGFYILTSTVDNKHIFVATLSSELKDSLNLKEFASYLKDAHGIQGGVSKNLIQGGASKFEPHLKADIMSWIAKHSQ